MTRPRTGRLALARYRSPGRSRAVWPSPCGARPRRPARDNLATAPGGRARPPSSPARRSGASGANGPQPDRASERRANARRFLHHRDGPVPRGRRTAANLARRRTARRADPPNGGPPRRAKSLPVYVTDLCSYLSVPERALERACQDFLGMGPKRYLWLRRLHLARRALIESDAAETKVAAVALAHGFWELGRIRRSVPPVLRRDALDHAAKAKARSVAPKREPVRRIARGPEHF